MRRLRLTLGRRDRGFGEWLEDRTGIGSLWNRIVAGTVERHGAWLRTTGLACLVFVLIECVTGPILGLYYTPAPNAAYRSILAIEQNPMGRFLRGLHHWSSATLIILAAVTLIRMFFGADYKAGNGRRRDIVWIASLLFLLFVLLLQLTGHILPWDTNAVKTADVEAGIGGNVWVFGPIVKRFLLGGTSTGAATLTRWYGFHVFLLPLLLAALVGLPLLAHRLRQVSGSGGLSGSGGSEEQIIDTGVTTSEVPADAPKPAGDPGISLAEPYYPYHLAREMVVALAVFALAAGMAWFLKTPLEKEATATNLEGYAALSEWYVLPLHALTLIPPFNSVKFEPLATFVLPVLLFTLLIVLPFVDRNPSRTLRKRPAAALLGALTLAGTVGLTFISVVTEHPASAPTATAPDATGAAATAATVNAVLAEQGKLVYKAQGCAGCHSIAGKGGKAGPDLAHAGKAQPDRKWQTEHLIKPTSKAPGSSMPAYAQLKKSDLEGLAEYMVSLK